MYVEPVNSTPATSYRTHAYAHNVYYVKLNKYLSIPVIIDTEICVVDLPSNYEIFIPVSSSPLTYYGS